MIAKGKMGLVAGCAVILAFFWFGKSRPSVVPAHQDPVPAESRLLNENEPRRLDNREAIEEQSVPVEQVLRRVFGGASSRNPYMDIESDELIALLYSETSMKQRQQILWALCFSGDAASREFLTQFISDSSENAYLRSGIFEGLALADQGWGYDLAIEALHSDSAVIARGAVKALGLYGGEEAVNILSELVYDFESDPAVSFAAAQALGVEGSTAAADALVNLFEFGIMQHQDEAIELALEGLAMIESEDAMSYLKEVYELASDPAIRVLVLEGVEGSEADIYEIAVSALSDEDAEVRTAAASALAYNETPLDPNELFDYIENEQDAAVRRDLYSALDNQDEVDVNRVMELMREESDPHTRLMACQVMCRQLMGMDQQEFNDVSGILESELQALADSGSMEKGQIGMIDRMLDRIEQGKK